MRAGSELSDLAVAVAGAPPPPSTASSRPARACKPPRGRALDLLRPTRQRGYLHSSSKDKPARVAAAAAARRREREQADDASAAAEGTRSNKQPRHGATPPRTGFVIVNDDNDDEGDARGGATPAATAGELAFARRPPPRPPSHLFKNWADSRETTPLLAPLSALDETASYLAASSLAPKTRRDYDDALSNYQSFVNDVRARDGAAIPPPFPVTFAALRLYLAHKSGKSTPSGTLLTAASLNKYRSRIMLGAQREGLGCLITSREEDELKRMVKAVKQRTDRPPEGVSALPIMWKHVAKAFPGPPPTHDLVALIKRTYVICSKYVWPRVAEIIGDLPVGEAAPVTHEDRMTAWHDNGLRWGDVVWNHDGKGGVQLLVRRAKTGVLRATQFLPRSQGGMVQELSVADDGGNLSLPAHLLALHDAYVEAGLPAGRNDPLFLEYSAGGTMIKPYALRYATANAICKEIAGANGLDPSRYSTHSLRHGGPLEATAAGHSKRAMMVHGNWKSFDSMRPYDHVPEEALAALGSRAPVQSALVAMPGEEGFFAQQLRAAHLFAALQQARPLETREAGHLALDSSTAASTPSEARAGAATAPPGWPDFARYQPATAPTAAPHGGAGAEPRGPVVAPGGAWHDEPSAMPAAYSAAASEDAATRATTYKYPWQRKACPPIWDL